MHDEVRIAKPFLQMSKPREKVISSLADPASPWASLIAQLVKNLPAIQETLVRFLGWDDLLEKGQATHSSILRLPLWLGW